MRQLFSLALSTVLAFWIEITDGLACQRIFPPLEEQLNQAESIFVGTIRNVYDDKSPNEGAMDVHVSRILKGKVDEYVTVRFHRETRRARRHCGNGTFGYISGKKYEGEYLILLHRGPKKELITSYDIGTGPIYYEEQKKALALLEKKGVKRTFHP